MIPNASGFIINSTDVPPQMIQSLGGHWVHIDWDTTQEKIFALVQMYLDAKMPVMLSCHRLGQVYAAKGRFGNKIDLAFKNEINNNGLPDFMDTQEYCALLEKLYHDGITVFGPNYSHWKSPVARWETRPQWADFKKFHGLDSVRGIGIHGYEYEPEELAALVKDIRSEIGNRLLVISEWGPSPELKDPKARADWFRRAMAAAKTVRVPVALYRLAAPTEDGTALVECAAYTKPWFLNDAGTVLVATSVNINV